jgi:hypothetical protein
MSNVIEKEISWDVLGYYLYLPATFIHHDPLLTDITWLQKISAEKHLADTLYMVSSNELGEPMYFFLMGTALLYLPFFFIGHLFAFLLGYSMDGFSMPYQYAMVFGGVLYTLIGLMFLRKILRLYFSEKLTSILLLLLVFGTNYIHHLTLKNLETVNVLFMFSTIVIWNTIKWHENNKFKNLIFIGLSSAFMALVKPTEIFILLIPILWNVISLNELKEKFKLVICFKKQILITFLLCLIIVLPQMSYWFIRTGSIIYDSYKNPGVGLDLLSPHILDALFSYRKGWLIYTPIMLFSLVGFYFMYLNNRRIVLASLTYFICSFFIIASWSEWWYGAAFSIRPLITLYPILIISLGYFLTFIYSKSRFYSVAIGVMCTAFIFLNQFQWWQLKNYILEPYRTTKEYYWATFLKTSNDEKDKELLLVNRDFSGVNVFNNKEKYYKISQNLVSFEKDKNLVKEKGEKFYRIQNNQEFLSLFEKQYKELTTKDHAWVIATLKVRSIDSSKQLPCLTLTIERKEGAYGYFSKELKTDSVNNEKGWTKYSYEYLTPEIRNTKDLFKCYIWNRSQTTFEIKDVKFEIYERK